MILRKFRQEPPPVPMFTAWCLAEISEAKGRQELFTRQSPQKLKALREHALIESALSSNRIEGVEIDPKRIKAVFAGKAILQDRNEEEVRSYRDALKQIHEASSRFAVSEETILHLHKLTRGEIWDAGQYKEKEVDIIEKYADGRSRIRFKTVSAEKTPAAMRELAVLWGEAQREQEVHPLIALAAFNLDFLCVHPFRDGNGRVSRLLLLLQCYQLGYEVGRYISIERLIEQNKDRYYETLEQSSDKWHEGKSDPWPYINFCLTTLKNAYGEFEERVGQMAAPRGEKTELVLAAIAAQSADFRVSDLQRKCPGVSLDMIRRVLKDLQKKSEVRRLGRGRDALWARVTGGN